MTEERSFSASVSLVLKIIYSRVNLWSKMIGPQKCVKRFHFLKWFSRSVMVISRKNSP